jgi:hypothetical protein
MPVPTARAPLEGRAHWVACWLVCTSFAFLFLFLGILLVQSMSFTKINAKIHTLSKKNAAEYNTLSKKNADYNDGARFSDATINQLTEYGIDDGGVYIYKDVLHKMITDYPPEQSVWSASTSTIAKMILYTKQDGQNGTWHILKRGAPVIGYGPPPHTK